MKNLFVAFIFLTLMNSCGSSSVKREETDDLGFGRKPVELYYQSSGYEKNFLADQPQWANFSQNGRCHRTTSIKVVDLPRLQKGYNLSYRQTLLYQYQFNIDRQKIMREKGVEFIPFKNEEQLFHSVLDKVRSEHGDFKEPKFGLLHLIWIDPIRGDELRLKQLSKKLRAASMGRGYPVFVSFCLAYHELRQLVSHHRLSDHGLYLSHEILSPYEEGKKSPSFFHLSLGDLFKKKSKIILYSPQSYVPNEFVGEFKVKVF